MRRVLVVVSFALMIAIPLLLPRLIKGLVRPPVPPLPGVSIPLPATNTPGAITPMPAADRIAAVRKRYLDATSYRDRGELVQRFTSPFEFANHATFTMAFERDGRSLWAFRQSDEDEFGAGWLYVVRSSDQREFLLWWTLDPAKSDTGDVKYAIGVPQGVSKGNSAAILPLFFGMKSPFSGGVGEPVDKGVELVEGVECAALEFPAQQNLTTTLWVDTDHAIRKIKNVMSAGSPEAVVTETVLRPVFDQPIPDDAFEFDPATLPK